MTSDNLMRRIAPVRILSRSSQHVKQLNETKNEVVTLCSMCNSTLKIVNKEVKEDEEKLEKINWQLENDNIPYQKDMEVKHFLEILRDEIGFEKVSKKVTVPLKGLKVTSYYGCMLLHPEKAQIDDPESPVVMENLVEALGAEVIDWSFFKYCCGSYHIVDQENLVNLDHQQKVLEKKGVEKNPLPIFYFTQLMAIAMGLPQKLNHFEDHHIDPKSLLKELGFIGRKKSK
ncbi:MAG: heterodisulfide reductase-related iron-sulfur binding cluster [Candidatus Heimdallarchaeaceae archaeon]